MVKVGRLYQRRWSGKAPFRRDLETESPVSRSQACQDFRAETSRLREQHVQRP